MDLPASILGAHQVKQIQEGRARPILQIGSDTFTRKDLARTDCFNFMAAVNLNTLLNQHLKVKNTQDLFSHHTPMELALPRMGAVSLAVLGAAFEHKKIGGSQPLVNWVKQHQVTKGIWDTLKAREAREISTEKKALKTRKGARRDEAHGIRVKRHEARQGSLMETAPTP